jgi:hypothetical protein
MCWNLFTADETRELLDGIVSGGAFYSPGPSAWGSGYLQNGVDVNFLGKLYAHGYYPDDFEDVRPLAQGEPIGLDHPIYDAYTQKRDERMAQAAG